IAEVEPVIERPGEALERLVGLWVDRLAENQLRVSPLVANAGIQMLGEAEITAVRHQIVGFLMRDRKISAGNSDTILIHALGGKVEWALAGIGIAVVRANETVLQSLADYFVTMPLLRTDAPIYPDNFYVSWLLRVAQFA